MSRQSESSEPVVRVQEAARRGPTLRRASEIGYNLLSKVASVLMVNSAVTGVRRARLPPTGVTAG